MISTMLVPPGGWVFYQGNIRIEEQTFNDLVNSVRLHRLNNNIEAGNPSDEVKAQICQKNPSICINQGRSGNVNSAPSAWDKFKSFAGSILRHYIQNAGQLVDQNTANIRAAICEGCHNNQKSDKECKTCGGFVEDTGIVALRSTLIGMEQS